MSESDSNKPAGGSFSSFSGDLELDLPAGGAHAPAVTPDPQPSPAPAEAKTARATPGVQAHEVPRRPLPGVPVGVPVEEREKRSILLPVFLLGVVGLAAYGGYYAYCSYQVAQKQRAFSQRAQDLRQALLRRGGRPSPEDVRQIVLDMAKEADVIAEPGALRATIEPLDDNTMRRLPTVAQTALGIAGKLRGYRSPHWVVGFEASLVAKHGIANARWTAKRYTWLDEAATGE